MKKFFFVLLLTISSYSQNLNFIDLQNIPAEYHSLLTTTVFNNKIIINCGTGSDNGEYYTYDFLFQYDTELNTWSTIIPDNELADKRYANGEVIGNSLYLFNGSNSFTGEQNNLVEIVNLETNEVTYGAENPLSRNEAGSASDGSNIFVFGGETSNDTYTNKLYSYNISSDVWTMLADMPTPQTTRGEIINDKIYVIGGYNGSVSNIIDIYNIENNEWESQFIMPDGVSANSLAVHNDLIFIIGDYIDLDRINYFDTSNEVFISVDNNMIGRRHSDAEVIDNNIYLIGGNQTASPNDGGWLNSLQKASLNDVLSTATINLTSEVIILPNPTTDFIKIKTISFSKYIYNIYDVTGKRVLWGENENDKYLSITNLSNGIYYFEVIFENFSKTFKIIKE